MVSCEIFWTKVNWHTFMSSFSLALNFSRIHVPCIELQMVTFCFGLFLFVFTDSNCFVLEVNFMHFTFIDPFFTDFRFVDHFMICKHFYEL